MPRKPKKPVEALVVGEKPYPTMQDVAESAGVSRATVSMALSGNREIPAATRERVREVAQRIGYRTNPMVASLMSLHRQRRPIARVQTKIAYLNPAPLGHPSRVYPVYRQMFAGAQERAREVNCEIEEFDLMSPGMTPERMRSILSARGIYGVIVGPLPDGTTTFEFDFTGFAAVGLGMSLVSPLLERVANDHFQSVALAVRKCAELGYRRIGFAVARDLSLRLENRWLGGYRAEIACSPELADLAPFLPATACAVPAGLPGWIAQERPEVVILCNAEPAAQAAVPPEIGMVLVGVYAPDGAVSGIYQNFPLMGRSVAERVITLLTNNSFEPLVQPVVHLVGGVWVPGETAPGPGRRRSV